MCEVNVKCCCGSGRSSGNVVAVVLGVIAVAVVVAPSAMVILGIVASLIQAVVIGMAVSAGIVVVGWIARDVIRDRLWDRQTERIVVRQQRVQQAAITRVPAEVPVITTLSQRAIEAPKPRMIDAGVVRREVTR